MTSGSAPSISVNDLPPEARKKLGLKRRVTRRKSAMDMHTVRTYAIRVLNVVADLTPSERGRVLKHALKLNDV